MAKSVTGGRHVVGLKNLPRFKLHTGLSGFQGVQRSQRLQLDEPVIAIDLGVCVQIGMPPFQLRIETLLEKHA